MSSTATTSPFDLFQQATTHLEDVLKSFQTLALSKPWNELGYFDSTQDEIIEHLYFRFMACRRVLTSITAKHCEEFELAEQQTKLREQVTAEATNNDASYSMDTMLSLAATLALFVYDASFVEIFQSDMIAVNKLNEKFYRVDIPEDTFNLLQLEVTDTKTTGRLKSLALAYVELSKADLPTSDEVAELSLQMLDLVTRGNQLARSLANETDYFNQMEHAKTGEAARQAKHYTLDFLVAARAHTYKAVSRLKIPTAYLIKFSDEQKSAVLEQVEPGDIILTYTSGYASDVFIPGAFKHGITFVGTPEQRIGARLDKATIESTCVDAPESKVHKLLQDVAIRTVTKETTNEKDRELDANVIESVAEGEKRKGSKAKHGILCENTDFRFVFGDQFVLQCAATDFSCLPYKVVSVQRVANVTTITKLDPDLFADGGHVGNHRLDAFCAEFFLVHLHLVRVFAIGQRRIELKGSSTNVRGNGRSGECLFQPPLADVTPGSDRVGNDVNGNQFWIGGSGHSSSSDSGSFRRTQFGLLVIGG